MPPGNPFSHDELFPLVYDELRALADAHFRRQSGHHTLQPTAIVHEAYLKLAGADGVIADRHHFYVLAARVIRQILVDHARTRARKKRGGGWQRVTLSGVEAAGGESVDLVGLDEALEALLSLDERKARLVELRFFADRSVEQAGEILGISRATADREWRFARVWLSQRLRELDDE